VLVYALKGHRPSFWGFGLKSWLFRFLFSTRSISLINLSKKRRRRQMSASKDFRNCSRVRHKSIIMLEDEASGYPFYAVMYNASGTGMYFESLFGLQSGTPVNIRIDTPPIKSARNSCHAKVVWCRELDDNSFFRYGVGVEYCQTGR